MRKVKADHVKAIDAVGGHDFLHAVMVAEYAEVIEPNPVMAGMGWLAGMCHNTDCLFPRMSDQEIKDHIIGNYFSGFALKKGSMEQIVVAVLEHSKKNSDSDGLVTVVLKDADRLANIGPPLMIRSGQRYSKLPCFDPRWILEDDPKSSYRNPRTVLRDVKSSLEWKDGWLRLPKAREIAEKYFVLLQEYVELMDTQIQETNLDQLPEYFLT